MADLLRSIEHRYLSTKAALNKEEFELYKDLINGIINKLKTAPDPIAACIELFKEDKELKEKMEKLSAEQLFGMLLTDITYTAAMLNFLVTLKGTVSMSVDNFLQALGFKKK